MRYLQETQAAHLLDILEAAREIVEEASSDEADDYPKSASEAVAVFRWAGFVYHARFPVRTCIHKFAVDTFKAGTLSQSEFAERVEKWLNDVLLSQKRKPSHGLEFFLEHINCILKDDGAEYVQQLSKREHRELRTTLVVDIIQSALEDVDHLHRMWKMQVPK